MADDCVFCRIVRGEIPAKMLANTADCVAFRDLDPKAPVHILVVPKKHITSLDDITEPDIPGKMTMLAAALARQEGISGSGYRTFFPRRTSNRRSPPRRRESGSSSTRAATSLGRHSCPAPCPSPSVRRAGSRRRSGMRSSPPGSSVLDWR